MQRGVVLLGVTAAMAVAACGNVHHLRPSAPSRSLTIGSRARTAAAWGEVYQGYRKAISLLDAGDPDRLLMTRCARRAARIQAESLSWLAPPSPPPAPAADQEA